MSAKIIGFLGVVCAILILVLTYTIHRINALESQKNDLKNDLCKKEQTIKEMERINEAYKKANKEAQEFREELLVDPSDNLDVVPADYILNRLRAD